MSCNRLAVEPKSETAAEADEKATVAPRRPWRGVPWNFIVEAHPCDLLIFEHVRPRRLAWRSATGARDAQRPRDDVDEPHREHRTPAPAVKLKTCNLMVKGSVASGAASGRKVRMPPQVRREDAGEPIGAGGSDVRNQAGRQGPAGSARHEIHRRAATRSTAVAPEQDDQPAEERPKPRPMPVSSSGRGAAAPRSEHDAAGHRRARVAEQDDDDTQWNEVRPQYNCRRSSSCIDWLEKC